MSKKCTGECGLVQPLKNFYKIKSAKRGKTYTDGICKTCRKAQRQQWLTNKFGRSNGYELKKLYGLTVEQFDQMFAEQDGLCKICEKSKATHVDHNHETKEVRGLLCHKCNTGLGFFNDDKQLIKNAYSYLDETDSI